MSWTSNPYSLALFASALISLVTGYMAWRRRSAPGAMPLFIMLVTTVLWAGANALVLEAHTPQSRIFWSHILIVGALCGTPAFLAFALQYTGREHWLTRRNIILISIIPVLGVLLEWTNDWHHLFYTELNFTTPLPSGGWLATPGIAYNIYLAYSYPLVLFGIVIIAQAFLRSPRLYRGQAGAILIGTLIPLTGNIIHNFINGAGQGSVDPTPILFTIMGAIYAYGLFSFRLFKIVPLARHTLVDHMTDGILVVDPKDRIIDINPAAVHMLGLTHPSPVGLNLDQLSFPLPDSVLGHRDAQNLETTITLGNDPLRYFDVRIETLLNLQNQPNGRLIVFRDITEKKQAEEQLRKLSRAVEASAVSVIITDTDGLIEYVNPFFSQLTGFSSNEVVGESSKVLQSGTTPSETYRNLWKRIKGGQLWEGEFVNKKKNGELYNSLNVIAPIMDGKGGITHYVAIEHDITRRKKAEESLQEANRKLQSHLVEIEKLQAELREQAIRDSLTGLFNRRFMDETIKRETQRAKRHGHPLSILMIELDSFKHFNDSYGHEAGDLVLRHMAELIKASTRTGGDTPCRFGGDEFVLILPETTIESAELCARRLREDTEKLNLTYLDQPLGRVTVSIGVANFPMHGATGDLILRAADKAMYHAKQAGKNRVIVSSPNE